MNVIWVLQQIEGMPETFSRMSMAMLAASVSLWKMHSPSDTRILYCDETSRRTLGELGIPKIYDKVIELNYIQESFVNPRVFWSASKLQALAKQQDEVLIIDNDFLPFVNPLLTLKEKVVCGCNLETVRDYYPTNFDPIVRKLSTRRRWPEHSINVGFLYLPDPEFTRKYAKESIHMMREMTRAGAGNSRYLIMAEQLLLSQMLQANQIEFRVLLNETWNCSRQIWEKPKQAKGLWNLEESFRYMRHYGQAKKFFNWEEQCREVDYLLGFVEDEEIVKKIYEYTGQ